MQEKARSYILYIYIIYIYGEQFGGGLFEIVVGCMDSAPPIAFSLHLCSLPGIERCEWRWFEKCELDDFRC